MNVYAKLGIEFGCFSILTFIVLGFFSKVGKDKGKIVKVPPEINYIIIKNKLNVEKINLKKLIIIINIITSINISLFASVVFEFVDTNILVILITLVLIIPISLIEYRLVANRFKK